MARETMNQNDLYRELLFDLGVIKLPPRDAPWLAVVLHTHRITLRADVELDECREDDDPGPITLLPISVSHTAEILSSLWPKADERGDVDFWYFLYQSVTPYEILDEIPSDIRHLADEARRRIESHNFIAELTED